MQAKVLARVQLVNGVDSDEAMDVFRFNLLKDYGSGLTVGDMKDFLLWMTTTNPASLSRKDKIKAKLLELKHFRLATYHVLHPDGPVPPSRSMFPLHRIGVKFLFVHRDN